MILNQKNPEDEKLAYDAKNQIEQLEIFEGKKNKI